MLSQFHPHNVCVATCTLCLVGVLGSLLCGFGGNAQIYIVPIRGGVTYWPIHGTPHCLDVMHITNNVFKSLFGTLLNMPERTKDGPKARSDLIYLGVREELQGGRLAIDHDQSEEDTDDPKGKRVKRNDYYCPLLLHSKSKRDRTIDQVPSRSESVFGLLGDNKQNFRPAEIKVQRDEVS